MNRALVSALVVILGAGVAGCSRADSTNEITELKLENLMEMALAEDFTPGREVIVSLVELPPHTTLERHTHPGEEFQYVLDGEIEIQIDGEPSRILKAGDVGHVPYGAMHTGVTGDTGARGIVFRVHTSGEAVRYLEEGGAEEQ
jgi:quercetin dioxygenase-like cupin family protein